MAKGKQSADSIAAEIQKDNRTRIIIVAIIGIVLILVLAVVVINIAGGARNATNEFADTDVSAEDGDIIVSGGSSGGGGATGSGKSGYKGKDKKDPAEIDSDDDGIPDTEEKALGLNPYSSDTDNDGIDDYTEVYLLHSNPKSRDTDGDGRTDMDEVLQGKNPLVAD